jgi:hypothetical protein
MAGSTYLSVNDRNIYDSFLAFLFAGFNLAIPLINMALFIGIFALLLKFGLGELPPERYQKALLSKRLPVILHIILAAAAVTIAAVTFIVLTTDLNAVINGTDGLWWILHLRTYLKFAVVFIAVFSFAGFYRSTPNYLPVSAHAVAVLAFVSAQGYAFGYIDRPEGFRTNLLLSLAVYPVGVALTLLLALLVKRLKKKG